MIKMMTACTKEIDDCGIAVREIREQLDLDKTLLRHSVGLMNFYPEFLDTGVAKAISDALPFDCVGCTTSNTAVPEEMGDLLLSVAVLTSDDVSFASGITRPIFEDPQAPIAELYSSLQAALPEKPSLLYVLGPVLRDIGGDEFIKTIDKISGDIPLFGSLAFTHKSDFSDVYTFFNGEHYEDALALVAMSGNLNPRFLKTSLPRERIIRQKAIVTESEKNAIRKINGLPVLEYLESIGLAENGKINAGGLGSIPLILTLEDGSQVVRCARTVAEDGALLCFGSVPVNSAVDFGYGDKADVIESTDQTLRAAMNARNTKNMLIFSCVARKWTLGSEINAEMMRVMTRLYSLCQYQFGYSGGEICPVPRPDGKLVNRFYNYSRIACVL